MAVSILDIFSIGIGPSSSHTLGPMRAANNFITKLVASKTLEKVTRVQIDLYGSLALTGAGHKTDTAIILGLHVFMAETIEIESMTEKLAKVESNATLLLNNSHAIHFTIAEHLFFHKDQFLSKHANGMRLSAYDQTNHVLQTKTYYSIGGGFIVSDDETEDSSSSKVKLPYEFKTAKELLYLCRVNNLTIAQLVLANEKAWRSETTTTSAILHIAAAMQASIERGCRQTGTLPGGLNVRRRAPGLFKKLTEANVGKDNENYMQWLNLFAIAVNEENAAGGRIVTAPTNGAAGIVPAVLQYYKNFIPDTSDAGVIDFLCVAAAIGILYKKGASLSAAEVGCQGEVGVACSMAAAALTAVLGGSLSQIENAAEMGMEHNLGLTCDPIKGLVQIPCIERNAMGAVQAVNCAELALLEDGEHHVSLDKIIDTMWRTGRDMQTIYKETSLGGLAVNITEC